MQAILDALPESAAVIDGSGRVRAVNPAWRAEGREEVGEPYPEATTLAGLRALLAGEVPSYELAYRAGGAWYHLVATPMAGGRALIRHLDVSERHRAEAERTRTLAALEAAQAVAEMGSWTYDVAAGSETWSRELYAIQGFPADAPPPAFAEVCARLHPQERRLVAGLREMVLGSGAAITVDVRTDPVRGPVRHLQMTFARSGAPPAVLLHGTVLDVTRRKQEEERLRASDERHVRLWERALAAQDQERRRIALELHDQAGSAMASLLVACRLLEGAGTLDEARERARRLAGDIATVLDDLARLARGLHPVALDEIGLDAALSRGIAGLAELHALEVSVDVALGDAPIAPEVELALYRIAQEAMTNVINHAEASRVTLICHRQGDEVVLALADDGRGFDADAADEQVRSGRLGLAGIRDRAALLGGGLLVTSRPGTGTRVEVRIPAVPAARGAVD